MLQSTFDNTKVKNLGSAEFTSPIPLSFREDDFVADFVRDGEKVVFNASAAYIEGYLENFQDIPSFEVAGPREYLHFKPGVINCGIVTCGGLVPGYKQCDSRDRTRALLLVQVRKDLWF
jgi:6-phosphofructokinase 1